MELPEVHSVNGSPDFIEHTNGTSEFNSLATNQPKENGSKVKQRTRLIAALQSTTIIGVTQASSVKRTRYKIFWSCIFVVCATALAINFYFITSEFISAPILTQLEREKKRFEWPHLTICNPSNPIPFWSSEDYVTKWNATMAKAENYTLPRYDPMRNVKIWEHYMSLATINPTEFFKDIIKQYIYKVEVISEDLSVAPYASSADMYERILNFEHLFEARLDTIRSPLPCFTLMPERVRQHLRLPRHNLYSIKIYFIMDAQSYLIYNNGFETRKAYFYITNPNSTILAKFPHYILPGSDTSFQMHEKIHKRVADCTDKIFNVELYDINMMKTRKFHGGYEDCRAYVSQEAFVKDCKCYNSYLPLYKMENIAPAFCTNMTIFNNSQMTENINCLNRVLRKTLHSPRFIHKVQKKCDVYRINPCRETSYFTTRFTTIWQDLISQSRYDSLKSNLRKLPNFRKNDPVREFWYHNLAVIRFDWGRKNTEVTYEEYEYTIGKYMSDFGGITGLWLGLSISSVFEIMEIFYKLFAYARTSCC